MEKSQSELVSRSLQCSLGLVPMPPFYRSSERKGARRIGGTVGAHSSGSHAPFLSVISKSWCTQDRRDTGQQGLIPLVPVQRPPTRQETDEWLAAQRRRRSGQAGPLGTSTAFVMDPNTGQLVPTADIASSLPVCRQYCCHVTCLQQKSVVFGKKCVILTEQSVILSK
jgi:surface antigen